MRFSIIRKLRILNILLFSLLALLPAKTQTGVAYAVKLPLSMPAQYSLCSNPLGRSGIGSMSSTIYHSEIQYSYYLPPCLDQNPKLRYPVVYLLNGQTYSDDQWLRMGLAPLADRMITNGTISPVIIIMPNDQDWRQPSESPFGRMLIEELIPFVDATYPTVPDRNLRAVGGLSRGASWALRLGLTRWDLFSRIGAHSLPVFSSDESAIPGWLSPIPAGKVPAIYIDTGNQDPEINHARMVESVLSINHLPHEWHLYIGSHDESYWSNHLDKYLCWYACGWAVLYYN